MIDRPLALGLLLAPFAYIGVVVVPQFPWGDAGGVGAAIAVCLFVAVVSGAEIRPSRGVELWALPALAGVALVTLAAPTLFGTLGNDLAAGLFLGIPVLAVVFAWRSGGPMLHRVVAYGFSLTWGLLLLAARESLTASGTPFSGPSYSSAFYQVNADQVTGLNGLLNGSGFVALPIHGLFDPVFTGLAGASVFGLLLILARPQTGLGVPLPVASPPFREKGADREIPATYGFSAAQRALFQERSVSEPALTTWPQGLLPVVWGAAAASAFLLVAVLTPRWALLAATVGLTVLAAGLVATAEVPRWISWFTPRLRRTRSPPASPIGSESATGPDSTGEESTPPPSVHP
jgi:hypothetical protein